MNRKQLMGALVVAAGSLLSASVYGQATPKVADKVEKAADKAEKKVEKAADKVEKAADKAEDKAKAAEERAARRTKEHDAQREKLKGMLKASLSDPQKQELRRHAERVARLERIKVVATEAKDTATAEKATSLITKENERHDKWMSMHATEGVDTKVDTTVDTKGGSR